MMKKKLTFLVAGVLVAAGTLAATQAGFFNLPSLFGEDKAALQTFRQHVPADTLYYLESKADQGVFLQGDNMQLVLAQIEASLAELESVEEFGEMPVFQFFAYLLRDFMEQSKKGGAALSAHYGLDETAAFAFYLDGLAPVIQVAIADKTAFMKVIHEASAASNLQYQEETWDGKPVLVWQGPKGDDKFPALSVAMGFENQSVAVALVGQDEPLTRKLQRLALAPESHSLAASNTIRELQETNNYTDTLVGYVNFVEIAKTLLKPNQTSAGKDLLGVYRDYKRPLDGACASEVMELVQTMPRIVFGYDRFELNDGVLDMGSSTVLELTHPQVIDALKNLNGHLAPHTTRYDDKLLAVGLGLDVSTLLPTINQLRNLFIQAQFQCPQLQMAQTQVKGVNPAILAMGTAMLQGVKGMGISLYDFEMTDLANGQFKADALLSVTAETPANLAALLGSLPGMQNVVVPGDGSAVPIDLPFPMATKPQIAIKGKNLVVFTGEKSASAADESAQDAINSNGLLAYTSDYQRLGELVENAMSNAGQLAAMETDKCIEMYSGLNSLTAMDMQFNLVESFTDKGVELRVDGQWNTDPTTANKKGFSPGNYRIEQMSEGCQWKLAGYETINAEGEGVFKARNQADSCDVYVADYKWQKEGARLSFNETKAMNRKGCADEWVQEEPTEYSCVITNHSDNGFTCLFSTSKPEFYRYNRY
jgi:hypothetical protein